MTENENEADDQEINSVFIHTLLEIRQLMRIVLIASTNKCDNDYEDLIQEAYRGLRSPHTYGLCKRFLQFLTINSNIKNN